ncbi:MAG: hypothetical protein EKK47_13620 [Burkholderiales bacterium]|nr:MAG: hypothetical protein EKK47_13620 [Burkholderiales bacterium]
MLMSIIEFLSLKSAVAAQKAEEAKAQVAAQRPIATVPDVDQEDPFDHPVNPVFTDSLFESTHCHF